MKKIIYFILLLIATTANSSFAQSSCIPNTLSLSAVARNGNNPVTTTIDVKVQLFIGDPATSTNEIYCEQIQNVQPNNFGEFSLEFGPAVLLCTPFATFGGLDWTQCDIWYKLSWRQTGSSSYTEIASNNFSSVPFAFASRTAEQLKDFNTAGAQNGNVMMYNSATQKWLPGVVSGGSGTISAGNAGIAVSASGGNTTITNTGDLSNTNEIQTLSISGNDLSLSNGGGTVALPSGGSAYTAGTGISISGNTITNTSTNTDAQTLAVSGNTLTISGGNSVTLPTSPVGSVTAFAGPSSQIPSGWLICDGQSYTITAYPDLYTAISTYWGTTSPGVTFKVPDLRGQFLRGVSTGTSVDPDASSRTPSGAGQPSDVGSFQNDEFKSHTHNFGAGVLQVAAGSNYGGFVGGGPTATSATGGNETRPKNAYVYYIIKATK